MVAKPRENIKLSDNKMYDHLNIENENTDNNDDIKRENIFKNLLLLLFLLLSFSLFVFNTPDSSSIIVKLSVFTDVVLLNAMDTRSIYSNKNAHDNSKNVIYQLYIDRIVIY